MYWYAFNVGDYRSHTAHLSITEHYIYRSLIDWYYLNERPMPASDIDYIAKILLLKTDEEKQALQSVLAEFFKIKKLKQTGDSVECYHHARIDEEIKNYRFRNGGKRTYDHTGDPIGNMLGNNGNNVGNTLGNAGNNGGNDLGNVGNVSSNANGNDFGNKGNVTQSSKGNVLTQAQRTAKSKAERKKIINDLQETGADFDSNASLKELREIYTNFFVNSGFGNGNDLSNVGNVSGNVGNFESNAFPHAITSNQEPVTDNQKPSIYTPVEISVDNSDSKLGINPYPIFDPDIETLNAWFLRAGVSPVEDNDDYRQELTRFNLHFAGHTRQEADGFWYSKMITWFKNVQNREHAAKSKDEGRFSMDNEDWDNPHKAVYDYHAHNGQTNYHPSHSPAQSIKPDPRTSVLMNGLWKPCLPGMTVNETYAYIKAHKDVGMTDDEVYDQVLKELEVIA